MNRFNGIMLCLLLMALASGVTGKCKSKTPPNILFIMSDDTGNADYQQVDGNMSTANLMALEEKGIVMSQLYTMQTCTPTRSALLTGRYPYKMGFQLGKIKGASLRWLNVREKLLPASLQELNYTTYAVGKWHLGFCNWTLTPTYRGFDHFYGFYGGAQGYFSHSGNGPNKYDFRDDERVNRKDNGTYSTYLFTKRVKRIIMDHGTKDKGPFFIYLAYQNSHAPFEADEWYVKEYCNHVEDEKRRIHCAMVAAMDDSIGNITRTLERMNMTNNTIVIYHSDNGGVLGEGSYNWPLRGGKSSFWEGGMRQRAAFVYPDGMKEKVKGTTWDGLFHVTDWYPTLYSAAGGRACDLQEMDGVNQLTPLLEGTESNRNEMIYNINPSKNRSAVRIGDYKYIKGKPGINTRSNEGPLPPGMTGNITALKDPIPAEQLYNVRTDYTETHNLLEGELSEELSTILERLKSLLRKETENVVPFPKKVARFTPGRKISKNGVWSPGWCDPETQDYTGGGLQ